MALMLSGCMSARVQKDVEINAESLRKGPEQLPTKNITDFNDSLRCMDGLFLSFGIARGDYVLLVEDLKDKTKKVDAGTRQMMITAISDMTRRSGALKLIAYGSDSGNLISFLNESGNRGAYQNVPAFDIIGSISQFDDGIYKAQSDTSAEFAGTNDGSILGAGGGQSSSSSVTFMTVDLGVVTSHNLAIIPGVNTRNTVTLFNKGTARSFDAGISKTGVSYSFSKDSKDAIGQSLRGLIELSTIELMGKLVKLPYWKCLGMSETHADIQNEVSDWFYQLVSTNILHKSLKIQLFLHGYYQGVIDNAITPEYLTAIRRFKQNLGLPVDNSIDLVFYTAFLNQTPISVAKSKLAYGRNAENSVATKAGKTDSKKTDQQVQSEEEPLSDSILVTIKSITSPQALAVGSEINLAVSTDTNGYLRCYFQRGEALIRIFPNRFSGDGYFSSQAQIGLPNSDAFSLLVEEFGESVHCFISPTRVDKMLPAPLDGADFTQLAVNDIAIVKAAYQQVTQGDYGYAEFRIGGKNAEQK